jgi:hypothetical protein
MLLQTVIMSLENSDESPKKSFKKVLTIPSVSKRGSRNEVFKGQAIRTFGGLTKDDLIKKNGRVISKKKSEQKKLPVEMEVCKKLTQYIYKSSNPAIKYSNAMKLAGEKWRNMNFTNKVKLTSDFEGNIKEIIGTY